MGVVIWQAPLRVAEFQGTARAVRFDSGRVLFEVSSRVDALNVPQWEESPFIPASFIECAAAIMAESAEKTVELTLAECPPIEPLGEWKKRRPGVLSRIAHAAGLL